MQLYIHVLSDMIHLVAQDPFYSSDRLNQEEWTVSYAILHVRGRIGVSHAILGGLV